MSGDKEDESGEPRKVLGLIWETEADRLKVDVKLMDHYSPGMMRWTKHTSG